MFKSFKEQKEAKKKQEAKITDYMSEEKFKELLNNREAMSTQNLLAVKIMDDMEVRLKWDQLGYVNYKITKNDDGNYELTPVHPKTNSKLELPVILLTEGKVVELPNEKEVLEVSTEPTDTKIEKENKTSFEEFKVLYKGQIDDKCLEDYGTIEDKKLWEDTAKELFMASQDYIPDEDNKAEKIEESTKIQEFMPYEQRILHDQTLTGEYDNNDNPEAFQRKEIYKNYKKDLEKDLEESKLIENEDERYQVREFEGPGAKFGVFDTKEKKFVQKGSKYVMTAACKDLNEKGKVTESSMIKNTLKEMLSKKEESVKEDLIKLKEDGKGLYDYVANNYYRMSQEELKELALDAIYVADNDSQILNELTDRYDKDQQEEYAYEIQEFSKKPYDFIANNYNNLTIEFLKEIALDAIYVANNDAKIIDEYTERMDESVNNDIEKVKKDSIKKGLYTESEDVPNITWILENYDWDVDIMTEEQLGSDYLYRKLCRNVDEAARFNYHSDYWGDADSYQDANIELMEQIEPYVGKEVIVDFDDGSQKFKILGIVIDKQYNSLSHTCILAEELGELKTEDHQLYYDDIQGMPTSERHDLWKQYHEEDFEDSEEGNNKFWDWAEEEFPIKELNESKLQEDQYESERRRGVPPIKRIAEQEVYDNEEWYKKHINDYLDITDFVNKNIKEIAAEYNLRDTKAEEACKKIYEIAIELNDKKEEAVEEEINVTDADKDINSVMVTYISNQTFMKYYNLDRPLTEKELDVLKLKIKNKEMYITDFKDKLNATEVNSRKELIPNTYVMKIKENDVEDLEESKQDKCVMCGNDNLDGCFVVKSNSICKDCGKKYSLDEIENKISNKKVKTESQVSDYTFKELNKVINDKGNDFKIQISGSEDKTNWLNIDKEDLQAIYQALQNKKVK